MIKFLVILLIAVSLYATLTQGLVGFDCRRTGQECQNGGKCDYDTGNCTCTTDFQGYDCSVDQPAATCSRDGASPCLNGATCDGAICHCAPNWLGNDCKTPSVSSSCNGTHLDLAVAISGSFTGVMYIRNHSQTEECQLVKNSSGVYTLSVPYFSPEGEGCGQALFGKIEESNRPFRAFEVDVSFVPVLRTYLDPRLEFRCLFLPDGHTTTLELRPIQLERDPAQQVRKKDKKTGLIGTVFPETEGPKGMPVLVGQIYVFNFFLDFGQKYNDIFLRSFVAVSVIGSFQIPLIQSGCPLRSARSFMRGVRRIQNRINLDLSMFKFPGSKKLRFNANCKVCSKKCRAAQCTDSNQFLTGGSYLPIGRRRRRQADAAPSNDTAEDEGETADVTFDYDLTIGDPLNPDTDGDGDIDADDVITTTPESSIVKSPESPLAVKFLVPLGLMSGMLMIATSVAIYMCVIIRRRRDTDTDSQDSLNFRK